MVLFVAHVPEDLGDTHGTKADGDDTAEGLGTRLVGAAVKVACNRLLGRVGRCHHLAAPMVHHGVRVLIRELDA